MASFYLPLAVMGFIYIKILLVVSDQKKKMSLTPSHLQVRQSIRRASGSNRSTPVPLVHNHLHHYSSAPSPPHVIMSRALVTTSVGGSPVTVTSLVSNSSSTSSPRRASVSRPQVSVRNNNLRKQSNNQEQLVSGSGSGFSVHALPTTPNHRKSSQQNGTNGSAITYFFTYPRLKKGKNCKSSRFQESNTLFTFNEPSKFCC